MRSTFVKLACVATAVVAVPSVARADCDPYTGPGNTNLHSVACDVGVIFGNTGESWDVTVGYIGGSAGNWHSLWAFTADQAAGIGSATGNSESDNSSGGIFLFCKFSDCGQNGSPSPAQGAKFFTWDGGEELVFGLYVKDSEAGNYWLFSGDRGVLYAQVIEWGRAPLQDGYVTPVGSMPGDGYRVFGFEDTDFSNECVTKHGNNLPINGTKCPAAKGDWDYNDAVFYFAAQFNDQPGTPTETVPEPATMTLLATGLAGLAASRRRRK